MKIAVTAQKEGTGAEVDPRFGRAECFFIIDSDTHEISYVDNKQNTQAMQGAGIQAAKTIINSGCGAIITGNIGPKAFATLNSAGIDIYVGVKGTVEDAVERCIKGQLKKSEAANKEGHW